MTERKPVLLVEKGAKFVEVDAEGVRFATVAKRPQGVPLLELAAGPVAEPAPLRRGPAACARRSGSPADSRRSRRADTRTVRVRSYDSISLELTGGRTVVWGSGEDGAGEGRGAHRAHESRARGRGTST